MKFNFFKQLFSKPQMNSKKAKAKPSFIPLELTSLEERITPAGTLDFTGGVLSLVSSANEDEFFTVSTTDQTLNITSSTGDIIVNLSVAGGTGSGSKIVTVNLGDDAYKGANLTEISLEGHTTLKAKLTNYTLNGIDLTKVTDTTSIGLTVTPGIEQEAKINAQISAPLITQGTGAVEMDLSQSADSGIVIGQNGDITTGSGSVFLSASDTITTQGDITTQDGSISVGIGGKGSFSLLGPVVFKTNATSSAGDITLGKASGTSLSEGPFSLSLETGADLGANVTVASVVDMDILTLKNIGGTASFSGPVTANGLMVPITVANLSSTGDGGTIANGVTFNNTGTLTLGQSGGTQTFGGGFDTSKVGGIVTLNGILATTGDTINLTNVTLGSNTTLNTNAVDTNGDIFLGGVNGTAFNLTLKTGAVLNADVFGLAGTIAVNTLALDTIGGIADFHNFLSVNTLTVAGSVADVFINNGSTITNAVSFLNTGTVTLGGSQNAVLLFQGGLISTAPTQTILSGTVRSSGGAISVEDLSLNSDSVLDSTNGGASPAGAAITLSGKIDLNGNSLEIRNGIVNGLTFTGNVEVTSGELIVNQGNLNLGDGSPTTLTVSGNIQFQSQTGAINVGASTSIAGGSNNLAFQADAINLNGAMDSIVTTGTVTLMPMTVNKAIYLGGAATGSPGINISQTQYNTIKSDARDLIFGFDAYSGTVNLGTLTTANQVTIINRGGGGKVLVSGQFTSSSGDNGIGLEILGSGATTVLSADVVTAGTDVIIDDAVQIDAANVLIDTTNGGGTATGANVLITGGTRGIFATKGETNNLTITAGTGGAVTLGNLTGFSDNASLASLVNDVFIDSANTISIPNADNAIGGYLLANNGSTQSITIGEIDGSGQVYLVSQVNLNTGDIVSTGRVLVGSSGALSLKDISTTGFEETIIISGATVSLGGNLSANNGDIHLGSNTTLQGDTTITSGGGDIFLNGDVTGNGHSLTLDAGGTGTIKAFGSITVIDHLAIFNPNGATFNGSVAALQVGILNTTEGISITFNNQLKVDGTFTAVNGGVAYNVAILGGLNFFGGAATFSNTGALTIGNANTDSTTFASNFTRSGSLALQGNVVVQGVFSTGDYSITNAGGDLNLTASNITLGANTNALGTLGLTVNGSGSAHVGNITNATTVSLNGDAGGAFYLAGVDATNLTTQADAYLVSITGDSTIANAVAFTNTGNLTLGKNGSTLNFNGGLDTTAVGGTVTIHGTFNTSDDTVNLGAITLGSDTKIDTNTVTIEESINLGVVTGGGFDLTLETSLLLTTEVIVASVSGVNTLTLQNIRGRTNCGDISATNITVTDVVISNFFQAVSATNVSLANVTLTTFYGTLNVGTLTVPDSVENLISDGIGSTITNAVVFANTGNLELGQAGGTQTFNGGFDTTKVGGTVKLLGSFTTSDDAITLGAVTLGSATTLDTHATTGAGDITLAPVTGANFNLTLKTGAVAGADVSGKSMSTVGTLALANIGGTASFDNAISAETLIVPNTVVNFSSVGSGGVIANAVSFANTGTLTLGQVDGLQNYFGGVTTTAVGGTVTLNGTIATSDDAITLGAITLGSATTLDTNATSDAGDITLGAVTGNDFQLNLETGNGVFLADVTGTSVTFAALALANIGGTASFTGPVISFGLTVPATVVNFSSTGSGGAIGTKVNFQNSGNLTLGQAGGIQNFFGGFNTTGAGGTVTLNGTLSTINRDITLGAVSLGSNTTLDINAGTSVPAINLGDVIGGGFDLTLEAGDALFPNVTGTSVSGVGTLALKKSVGTATFTGAVFAETLLVPSTVNNFLSTGTGGVITNLVNFQNSGKLTLGQTGGTQTYNGGFNTNSVGGKVTLNGILTTSDDAISLGAITLGSNLTLDTNAASTAGDITLGFVTGGDFNLTLETGAVADADVSGTLVNGVETLTLGNIGGTASFSGGVSATTLLVPLSVNNFSSTGTLGIIVNPVIFENSGNLTLGRPGGTSQDYAGGFNTTAVTGTVTLTGAITTSNNSIVLGTFTLGGNTFLNSTGGQIFLSGTGLTANNFNLDLNGGDTGAIISNGPVTGFDTLTIANSNGVFFFGPVTGTTLVITDTTDDQAVVFAGNQTVTLGTLTTAAQGYGISFLNIASQITNPVTFNNTGGVVVGDGSTDALTLINGGTIAAGTLSGIGLISGAVTILTGAVVAPGNSPGILTFGDNLTFNSGSNFNAEVEGLTLGNYDQAAVNGAVTLGNATLNTSSLVTLNPSAGNSITLIANDGDDAVSGIFNGLPERSKITVGGATFVLSYVGGDGNDVTLTFFVAEPVVATSGLGANGSTISIFTQGSASPLVVTPFPFFKGDLHLATADLNGDGTDDVVVGAGPGAGPAVALINGQTGGYLGGFFAYNPAYRGGVFVSTGDLDGDGSLEIITGAGPGGGPHVQVFDADTFNHLGGFFAYDVGFRGGVTVAAGDFDNDGIDEIVTGAGPGGGPNVRTFSGPAFGFSMRLNFFAYMPNFTGGVFVAAGNYMGDFADEIITGAGAGVGAGPQVTVFDGIFGEALSSFYAYAQSFNGGVRVGASDYFASGLDNIITGPGAGGAPHVIVWQDSDIGTTADIADQFFSGDVNNLGGLFVS